MIHAFKFLDPEDKGELKLLHIWIKATNITLHFKFTNSPFANIIYKRDGSDCLIYCEQRQNSEQIEMKNTDYLTVFCQDLKKIFMEQVDVIKELEIIYDDGRTMFNVLRLPKNELKFEKKRVLETILEALNERNEPIRIEQLKLNAYDIVAVKKFLPLLNTHTLKKVDLTFSQQFFVVNIENVLSLKQWKNFEGLRVIMKVHMISKQEMLVVKKTLTTSRTFNAIQVYYDSFDKSKLDELFGLPYENAENEQVMERSAPMPNDPKATLITFEVSYPISPYITFHRKDCENVESKK